MNTERIKEIQSKTAYPESISVQQALLQVWNECEQEQLRIGAVSNSIATEYAEFCVRCDREKLPLLCLDDYIKQYCC
jgi:hypothetical protein